MPDAAPPMLELRHVNRRRGGRPAVCDLSLSLRRGDVLGLLGVNGAGKSTTLAMMVGALTPDSGTVLVDGLDLAEHPACVRHRVGWLPERAPLYEELTVAEQLDAAGRLRGLNRADLRTARERVLERLQLGELRNRLVGHLSQGQRQRAGLACALLHEPPLVVLDEPCNGLDPVQIGQWRAVVAELAADSVVIVSTHVLAEVTASCNRVAILHEGTLRYDGTVGDDTDALERRFFAVATQAEHAA
jgi:ABC-2 type transport system ATP-binding protein